MSKIVFNYTEHRELWDWLSKHPGAKKRSWPGWKKLGINPYDQEKEFEDFSVQNLCFACQYDYEKSQEEYKVDNCSNCPLMPDQKVGNCLNGLFANWEENSLLYFHGDTSERVIELAQKIRDLPVLEGVKYI